MFRKDILCIFYEHLKIDASGKYFVELNDEICYLDVEDTAFVVIAVYKTKNHNNGQEQIEVLLSDDSLERLDLNTLTVGKSNVMYCRIKEGKFRARFTRKSYYQLAEFIKEDVIDHYFYINLNDERYLIKELLV